MRLPSYPSLCRYVKKGKIDRARASLSRVRDTDQEVEDETLMIREALEFEKEAISSSYSALWKDRSVRKRLLLAFVINAGQQITGQGTLNTYSTIIYKKVFTSASTIALINALNATFGILFTANATWTVDRFGRKFLVSRLQDTVLHAHADIVGIADCRCHWHGHLHDYCGRGRNRDTCPTRRLEVRVGWHLNRVLAVPVHLFLQAIVGRDQ